MKRLLLCAGLACLFAAVNLAAQTPAVTIKCSDVNVSGATETDSYAVNNNGVIAGDYIDSSSVQHGLILAHTTVKKFDGPSGSSLIAAYGINKFNAVVGWYIDANGVTQGFEYANGKMHSVFVPNSTGTEPNGINDNGWIVGQYFDSTGVTHGFYWDTKKYHAVNVSGAPQTFVWAINNANLMTVNSETSTGASMDGYTYDGKTFTKVDVPGATSTVAHGINNKGDLDYTIFDSSGNRHGVIYQAATKVFTQFDDANGVNSTRADGINDTDAMVGRYSPTSGTPPNQGFRCVAQ